MGYIVDDALQWRHNGHDGVSNHQPHECVFNRAFRRRSKRTSKLCFAGFCAGNSAVTGEFPAQRASNAENVSIWWRHHVLNSQQVPHSLPSRASNYMSDHCVYVEKHRPRYKAITLYDIRMSQMRDNGEGLGVVTLTMESYIIMPSYGGSITRSLIPHHVVGFITRSDITRDCINHWNH